MRGEEVVGIAEVIRGMDADEQEDDDDEGSWESIDTDEEEVDTNSATDIIYDFFNQRSYKHQETEESAFEAMYARDD